MWRIFGKDMTNVNLDTDETIKTKHLKEIERTNPTEIGIAGVEYANVFGLDGVEEKKGDKHTGYVGGVFEVGNVSLEDPASSHG